MHPAGQGPSFILVQTASEDGAALLERNFVSGLENSQLLSTPFRSFISCSSLFAYPSCKACLQSFSLLMTGLRPVLCVSAVNSFVDPGPYSALTGDREQENGLNHQYEIRRKIEAYLEPFVRRTQASQKERAKPEPFRGAVRQKGGGQPIKPVARRK